MKLINCGLGRTGTTSLKGALEILGISPIYHTTDMFKSTTHIDFWESVMRGQPVDWSAFFGGYEVADWPAGLAYREIIAAFPEAKVMLTMRDPVQWFNSINGVMSKMSSMRIPSERFKRAKKFLLEYAINGFFEGKVEDQDHMVELFARHTEAVKALVPAERLLVYDVREGWEPLCRFLEVDVPNKSFPRLNQRAGFKDMAAMIFGR